MLCAGGGVLGVPSSLIPRRRSADLFLCRRSLARAVLCAILSCAMLGDSTARAQNASDRARRRAAGGIGSRVQHRAPRGALRQTGRVPRGSIPGRARNLVGINRGDARRSDPNAFIDRPRSLLTRSGYSAPLNRMSLSGTVASLRNAPSQADFERAIEEVKAFGLQRNQYTSRLATQMHLRGRRLAGDGWTYFEEGDFLRARSSFESAEIVSESSPVPRFGKLMVDVAQRHYRRAITQLARNVVLDARQPSGVDGLFEYDVSLLDVFGDEEGLRRSIIGLQRFAQENLDNPGVQALYCYVLWYSGIDEFEVQASGVAAQLVTGAAGLNSPWARFSEMIEKARAGREEGAEALR